MKEKCIYCDNISSYRCADIPSCRMCLNDGICFICGANKKCLCDGYNNLFYNIHFQNWLVNCRYCNYDPDKNYIYTHHCTIPMKNKYMNINVL